VGNSKAKRLHGKVVRGGDWTLLRSDGVLELDLRLTLATDSGARIDCRRSSSTTPADVIAALAAASVSTRRRTTSARRRAFRPP